MHSPCFREASQACFYGCCPNPLLHPPEADARGVAGAGAAAAAARSPGSAAAIRHDFIISTLSSLYPDTRFTNHESLPSLENSFSSFIKVYPKLSLTDQADKIRMEEYQHLSMARHVCLDYIGHGLFSYSQLKGYYRESSVASSSSSPLPLVPSPSLEPPFFDVSYRSVNLKSKILYGEEETEIESRIKTRIMGFMNISEDDYSMVFTANQSSAFKLVADFYPFQSYKNLLTVYDYESEAIDLMVKSGKQRGANPMSAEFSWPNLRIQSGKLRKKILNKNKTKGLFVFPLQSRVTGSRYSYLWMNHAQENGWHVLLDASALGAKDMETLGLSLFKPDFLICSFFKVFGENPSGFGCLFIKKSSALVLKDEASAKSMAIVNLVPTFRSSQSIVSDSKTNSLSASSDIKQKGISCSEIEELDPPSLETGNTRNSELELKGLDHADKLGLILISTRVRCLINWLVNALMSLHHPNSEHGAPAVRIYGPKVKFDRGPALAFNVFDWKDEKIDPALVQKLADRNNISLSIGVLQYICFPDKYQEHRNRELDTRKVSVVTAALGYLTSFEDIYRLWAFVSLFLDADFLEKERWRYKALNQETIEI